MILKLNSKISLIIMVFLILSCHITAVDIEKIKTFFKYDKMFFYSTVEIKKEFETGYLYEIFDINKLNKNSIPIADNYSTILKKFIDEHMNNFQLFYIAVIDLSINEDDALKIFNDTKKLLIKELLPNLLGAIRCTLVVKDIEYIEVAININENLTAANTNPKYANSVYWSPYLTGWQPTMLPRDQVLDEQGVIKYNKWFYESNLKLRVVKQIRDKDGKYYGEIYADYYKLEEYDKLFDKDGNPKNPKEESK